MHDRPGRRALAAGLLEGRLDAWDARPVLAYGFEDMTRAQVRALRALAARCQVTVSLPYEVDRPAYAAVRPLVDGAVGRRRDRGAPARRPPRFGRARPPRRGALLGPSAAAGARRRGRRRPARGLRAPRGRRTGRGRGGRARPGRPGAGRDRRHRAVGERPPGGDRGGVRRRRRAGLDGRPRPARPHRFGGGAARGAAVRLDGRRAAGAVRVPAQPVLGHAAPAGGLPRGAPARPRRHRPRRGGRGAIELSSGGAFPALDRLAAESDPVAGMAVLVRDMVRASRSLGAKFVPEHARGEVRAARAVLRADRRDPGAWPAGRARAGAGGGAAAAGAAPVPRRSRAACRCSTCAGRARAGSRSRSCSGWRRARSPAAGRSGGCSGPPRRPSSAWTGPTRPSSSGTCSRSPAPGRGATLYLARQAATDDGRPLEPSPFWPRSCACSAPVGWRSCAGVAWRTSAGRSQAAPSERERLRALARGAARRPRSGRPASAP